MTPPHHTPPGGDAGSGLLNDYIDLFGERYGAAIAAAPAPAAPWAPSWPRLRSGLRPLAAIGAVVVAVAIVITMALPTGSHLSLVDRASAALGAPNEIIHFEVRGESLAGVPSNPACEGRLSETWQTTSGPPRWRIVIPPMLPGCGQTMTADGERVTGRQESAVDGTTSVDYTPSLGTLDTTTGIPDLPADAPSIADTSQSIGSSRARDFVANLQGMLAQGELRQVGAARVERGRRIIVLAGSGYIKNPQGQLSNTQRIDTTYVVDATTFVPLRLTSRSTVTYFDRNGKQQGKPEVFGHTAIFTLYERLPLNATTAKLLSIHPTGPVEARTETLAERTKRLHLTSQDPPATGVPPAGPRPSSSTP